MQGAKLWGGSHCRRIRAESVDDNWSEILASWCVQRESRGERGIERRHDLVVATFGEIDRKSAPRLVIKLSNPSI